MSIGLIDQAVLQIKTSLGPGCANGAGWTLSQDLEEKRYAAWFAMVKRNSGDGNLMQIENSRCGLNCVKRGCEILPFLYASLKLSKEFHDHAVSIVHWNK